MVGSGSRSQDLLGDDIIVFFHISDYGWFKRCELRIHFWKVSIYNVWSKTCESGMDKANFGFKMTRKESHTMAIIAAWVDREGAGLLIRFVLCISIAVVT